VDPLEQRMDEGRSGTQTPLWRGNKMRVWLENFFKNKNKLASVTNEESGLSLNSSNGPIHTLSVFTKSNQIGLFLCGRWLLLELPAYPSVHLLKERNLEHHLGNFVFRLDDFVFTTEREIG